MSRSIKQMLLEVARSMPRPRKIPEEEGMLFSLITSLPKEDDRLLSEIDKRADANILMFRLLNVFSSGSDLSPEQMIIIERVRRWGLRTGKHRLVDVVDQFQKGIRISSCNK